MRQLADEADLHLLAQHQLEHLLGMARPDDQVDVRERLLEAAQDERQHVGRDRRRRADEQLPDAALAALAQELPPLGERLQRSLRVGPEGPALGGQAHPARRADEELDPELALEVLDPRRQRGLGHVEDGRGGADRAPLGDGQERLDLVQQHAVDINGVYRTDRELRFVE